MRGGMKTYRGSPAAARNYVENDRGRADDYYLVEGAGVAERFVASPEQAVRRAASLTGDGFEAWVAGVDPETGAAKGRLRHDANSVRFVEVTVNGPKSWSLAAALHPDIAAAYDAAQDSAATQIVGWLARHATTRVGPRGAQVQVPVEQIEAVTVRHYTSRAGDPHRHLHLQINARVLAAGKWRGLHTVGVRDSLDATNGIGHAAVMTDPGFRAALAAHGFTLDNAGEVVQLAPFVGAFSARAAQIGRNIDRYETDWQAAHPGQTPGPALRRSWDARAWADARPDKIRPAPGTDLTERWRTELTVLGYVEHDRPAPPDASTIGSLNRDRAVDEVLVRLAARRSGWNAADVRGEVEQLIARHQIVTDAAVRSELAEDLTARAVHECVPLLTRSGVPEHVRALTSRQVLAVETELAERLAARASAPADDAHARVATMVSTAGRGLDKTQLAAANLLAGGRHLAVVEGAAGSGKTSTLAAARELLAAQQRRLTVVTPTLRAAKVAEAELGSRARSAAWLVHQHGFRWDSHGSWTRLQPGQSDQLTSRVYTGPTLDAVLRPGDLLLVDEAGMLDQDTARALLIVADEQHQRVAFVGDRHQLSAVGRGGVLDLAARWADPDACLTLDTVHRFTRTATAPDGSVTVVPDVEYAQLSLAMRTGDDAEEVFPALVARGDIAVHADEAERVAALAGATAQDHDSELRTLLVADTREQVAQLNAAVRERLVATGRVDDQHATSTEAGERIGVGDRVVTRCNNTELGVANRDSWTVAAVDNDASIVVTDGRSLRSLPVDYVREHVELGYACTVHGVQGDTADAAHLLLGEHTGASSAYVGMTRGRSSNTAHLVAADLDEAREQWVATFARDRADVGPAHAAQLAATEAASYVQPRPLEQVLAELCDAWTVEADARERVAELEPRAETLRQIVAVRAAVDPPVDELLATREHTHDTADATARRAEQLTARVTSDGERIRDALTADWDRERRVAGQAGDIVAAGSGRLGQRRGAVHAAQHQLEQWATTWRPYVADLPTDPAQLAAYVRSWDDSTAIWTSFDRYAQRGAAELHPDRAAAVAAAARARAAERQAHDAWRAGIRRRDDQLRPYGPLAHSVDPAVRLADTEHALTDAHAQLDAARHALRSLEHDPAIASRPADMVAGERDRWAHQRASARAEEAQRVGRAKATAALADPARTPPWLRPAAGYSTPDPGPSIGL